MLQYVLGRIFQGIINLLFIASLVFVLGRLSGDPRTVLLPDTYQPEALERAAKRLGLDRPLYVQYGSYMKGIFTLDWGRSYRSERRVSDILIDRLPATFSLAMVAMGMGLIIAVPLGVLSAFYRDSPFDGLVRALAFVGQSTPPFWLAIMMILVFAVHLQVLPVAGRSGPSSYILPAFTVAFFYVAGILRLTRSSMLEALESDYILMARAKGLPESVVVGKHALRNALIPVVTFSGLVLGLLLNGAVVAEVIFAWPGVGLMILDSVFARDFPVVQMAVVMVGAFFVFINIIVDLLYVVIDPRIKY